MGIQELVEEGWHISTEGYDLITDGEKVKDKKTILNNALNTDIREFGDSVLGSQLKQNNVGKVILQIQKIRNVATPKVKEDSSGGPRLLKLTLTDGHTSCQAIDISNILSISRANTPPGSKLLINSAKICSNCILLSPNCCKVLGGKVPALWEKWELAKNIAEHVRASGTDGAPPWVNFGGKIISSISDEPFKALADKTTKETSNEFDVHRQDAIAVASTGAVRKVFGGGTMQVSDNQQNNRRYNNARENRSDQETRGFRGRRDNKEKNVEKPQKPSEKFLLFDFLEDRLPVNKVAETNYRPSIDNNFVRKEFQTTNVQQKNVPLSVPKPNWQNWQQKHSNNVDRFRANNFTNKSSFKTNTPRNYENPAQSVQTNANVAASNSTTNSVEAATKNFGKMSINNQFASRSLRQHLNLGNNRNVPAKTNVNSSTGALNWKVGHPCLALYWEDGRYYNATITNLTERTCVVRFDGYGNVEEVLKDDCLPHVSFRYEPGFILNADSDNNKGSSGYRNNRRIYSNNRSYNKPA